MPPDEVRQFQSIVTSARIPANAINNNVTVDQSTIPSWVQPERPPAIIHSGIAKLSITNAAGEKVASTWLPFTLEEIEIIHRQGIIDTINRSIQQGGGQDVEFYQADIDRIEGFIRYYQIIGNRAEIQPEVFGVYQSGGLG